MTNSRLGQAVLAAVLTFTLAGCGDDASAERTDGNTIEVEDNNGTQSVPAPPRSVVATDNRTFETLSDWGVELAAAPIGLMPDTIDYTKDDSIEDLGTHMEPDLEKVVVADPDLVIVGQRFTDHADELAKYAPNASVINLEPREGEPFEEELKRQTTVLGEIFDKQQEAQELNDDLDAAIARVKAAYDAEATVLAVTTSGGTIGYLAPTVGRTLGPVYDFAGLTPALGVDDASDHDQGDEISVEAIAQANPDWILVMDRDAAIMAGDSSYQPAADILEGSQALRKVNAIKDDNVVYMPADTYTNEGIQTYTEFLNDFADRLEAAG